MSRWCIVKSKRFDFALGVNRFLSADRGKVLYLPRMILEAGVRTGHLERIPRPPGYKVNKKGVVQCS